MSASEESEESELMLKPARENSENVLKVEGKEYEQIRKRSIYGPKGLGKIIRVNVSGEA